MVIAACSKKDAASEKVASCLTDSVHSCVEYRGGNLALGTESLASLCTAIISSAKFSETPCPTTNVIGACQRDEGKDIYYQGFEGIPDLEKSCRERGGKFTK